MIKELLNKLKSIQLQPKERLQSPANLKKLEGFKQDLSTLLDITSCQCPFDLSAQVHNGKVTCIHPFDKQIPERELPFILDQQTQRSMVIGNVDTAVTAHSMPKKRHQEESLQAMTSTSCDSDASMPISLPMTKYYSSDSTDDETTYSINSSASGDEWQSSSSAGPSVISNKACTIISTKKLSSYRLSQAMLDCGAEQLNAPDAK